MDGLRSFGELIGSPQDDKRLLGLWTTMAEERQNGYANKGSRSGCVRAGV